MTPSPLLNFALFIPTTLTVPATGWPPEFWRVALELVWQIFLLSPLLAGGRAVYWAMRLRRASLNAKALAKELSPAMIFGGLYLIPFPWAGDDSLALYGIVAHGSGLYAFYFLYATLPGVLLRWREDQRDENM